MIDVTSTDPYEVARSQGGGDPIPMHNQCLAVKMREEFVLQTIEGSKAYPAGDYLVVNNQQMKRVHVSAEAFELLFDVRQ